jgi:hypothetical protein
MDDRNLTPSAIIENWKRDKNYKNKAGFIAKWPELMNFKEGIQWPRSAVAKWKNFTFITLNQCNFIINNRKSNILSQSIKIVFNPEASLEGEEVDESMIKSADDYTTLTQNTWDDVDQDQLNNDAVDDALTIGTGVYHYYFDEKYSGTKKNPTKGKICGHTIDALDVALANPQLKSHELNKQKWILVRTYEDTDKLKEYAKKHGENYMNIVPNVDNDEEYENGKIDLEQPNKTVAYTMYYKENGEVWWIKVCAGATIQKKRRLSPTETKFKVYPVEFLTFEPRNKSSYGRSAIEDAISVQKAINFLYSMIAYGVQQTAWPKILAKAGALLQAITNNPGEVITDHDNGNPADSVKFMQPPNFSNAPQALIDNLTATLRQTTGSDQTISGEALGANMAASAIIALQNQAKKPNDYAMKQLFASSKRIGKIWENFYKCYYIMERTIVKEDSKGLKTAKRITPSEYKDMDFGMTIDVGPGGDYSESLQFSFVEGLYTKGDITKYQYVKYAPNNVVPPEMKSDFEEEEQKVIEQQEMQAEMQQNQPIGPQVQQPGINMGEIMAQLTPEEQQAVMNDPSLLQGIGGI